MIRLNLLRGSMALRGLVFLIAAAMASAAAHGQISSELEDLYREMMRSMDGDLRQKIQRALNRDEDFIELTADQFRRFRDHPANPFDGWDKIDPAKITGRIRIEFEIEPIRGRKPGYLERQHSFILGGFREAVADASLSTVELRDGSRVLALGAIVTPQGHIVTKASEVRDAKDLNCRTWDGRIHSVRWVGQSSAHDVAILRITADGLVPVQWATEPPVLGSFVITPHSSGDPLAMGVYSHAPRSLVGRNQAFLGITPYDEAEGIVVREITPRGAADQAGMRRGDVIVKIDGVALRSVDELVNAIRQRRPGDKINIEYMRGGSSRATQATLDGRNVAGATADRFKTMNRFGTLISTRFDEFPQVFQHDSPLLPEQCGGPVVNTAGKVVGINIARAGRVESYALPASVIQSLVADIAFPAIAGRDSDTQDR